MSINHGHREQLSGHEAAQGANKFETVQHEAKRFSQEMGPRDQDSVKFQRGAGIARRNWPNGYPYNVPDGFETSDMVGIGVAAALAQQYATEQREFLPLLARVLKDSMPDQVQLIETGLFKKTLRGVMVSDQGNRLTLEDQGRGPLQASFTRVVRGIALKTETVTVNEWLTMVGEMLERQASENATARTSLAKMLGLD